MKKLHDMKLTGSIVALVTPMTPDGRVDQQAWDGLLDWHADSGTSGLVVGGTTGESATLVAEERDWLLERALERAGDRCRVVAGTGSASTAVAVEQSRRAADLGAHAVLVVTPFYNRPPQRGLAAHYRAVADACPVPVILYNVPGRTAVDLDPQTTIDLCRHANIAGIKEAVADMDRVKLLVEAGVGVLSGDDPSALEAMKHGAVGVISVAANVAPKQFARMCAGVPGLEPQSESQSQSESESEAELVEAGRIDRSLQPLYRFLAAEPNPIPVKWLLARMGRIDTGLRLPLVPLAAGFHATGRELAQQLAGRADSATG